MTARFPALASTSEKSALAVEVGAANGVFNDVVVDLDRAIGQEAVKAVAVLDDVGQRRARCTCPTRNRR